MATKIEWTDESWNPVTGCTKVSPGCANCYAEIICKRFWKSWGYESPPNHFKVKMHPDRLGQPLRWRKPRMIFVCSMGDLFHEDVSNDFIEQVFAVMLIAKEHTFQILTKRPERMENWLRNLAMFPYPNVWLGVSVEDQKAADERIPWLLKTHAILRYVSYEPALGSIDFTHIHYDGKLLGVNCLTGHDYYCGKKESIFAGNKIGWVILGCESGPKRRPFNYDWAQQTRFHCKKFGIPFFFKQAPVDGKVIHMPLLYGKTWDQIPEVK